MERTPVSTMAELSKMDPAEMGEGYLDGLLGDSEPGDNRSKAYWHGWRNGSNDRAHRSDPASRALARELLSSMRRGLP